MSLISAELIFANAPNYKVHIPDRLLPAGPREEALAKVAEAGQMQGTEYEKLVELAGRACYDSLGRGRKSPEYHQHIAEVGHGSVWEHANFTVEISSTWDGCLAWLMSAANRPSLYSAIKQTGNSLGRIRMTMNLRHVKEWRSLQEAIGPATGHISQYYSLLRVVRAIAPQITGTATDHMERHVLEHLDSTGYSAPVIAAPECEEEKWITMLLTGSRGFSHELVRHGDWTAISQRSTRYVDENESPWVVHPLLEQFFSQADVIFRAPNGEQTEFSLSQLGKHVEKEAKYVYKAAVAKLEPWLISAGVDKFTARKQARGAARGYLGNALYTEVVFSASVAQWKRMLKQRLNPAADAEIREVFSKALDELKSNKNPYNGEFVEFSQVPSPDGIGKVLG